MKMSQRVHISISLFFGRGIQKKNCANSFLVIIPKFIIKIPNGTSSIDPVNYLKS